MAHKCITCKKHKTIEESEDDFRCQGCGHNELECCCLLNECDYCEKGVKNER